MIKIVSAARRLPRPVLLAAALSLTGLAAHAQTLVTPVSYDMPNGDSGSYLYHDDKYNGSGDKNTNGAFLSGGVGDLTDGVIATDNWFVTEASNSGPYVGWVNINPLITFNFASTTTFQNVRIYFDDAKTGGVSAPASVSINGTTFNVNDPAGTAPFFNDFDISSFAPTNTLAVQLNRADAWVFASEFQFSAASAAAPEPSALALGLPVALPVMGIWVHRKRKHGTAL